MEDSQVAQRGQKRNITSFPSANIEGCSSTIAETFEHYKPSPTQHRKRYHVFLSFRGKDGRNPALVDHLFTSLSSAGFHVFMDTDRIEERANIGVSIEEAITNSTVHIPIFSLSYGSSSECLEELSLIWNCKFTCGGTKIIPLFYNVEPSNVRDANYYAGAFQMHRKERDADKKGYYAGAFKMHRKEGGYNTEKMDAWKKALHEISLLSGWSLTKTGGGDEDRLVKIVVKDLVKTLNIDSLYVAKHPVGLSDRMEEVKTLLKMNEDGGQVFGVGIWGMGGLGKTTLAKAVYNNIHGKFQASCFVSDVQALTKGSAEGLLNLQKQVLQDLVLVKVDESKLKLHSVESVKVQMENLLRPIKALVILDDVDDEQQLDALIGDSANGYWFGAGSRIIVTTRDSEVLSRQFHVVQYPMRSLDPKDGLELFSWHAFMRTGPDEDYQYITQKIVDACQGLPLSLEFVGARLYREKSHEIWREALKNLVKDHNKIYNTLKISYDALSSEEKRMFLDIVCFFLDPLSFPRYDMELYVKILEALDQSAPRRCLRSLERKSLVRINYDRSDRGYSSFWMHNHLRDLGRQIIEEPSPSNPAERNSFWRHKTQGMLSVEGLVLDFSQAEEGLHQICSTYSWEDKSASELQPISPFWPKTIGQLKFLCFLNMSRSSKVHLPNEVGKLINLEELYLSGCNLKELPESLGELKKLKILDVSYNDISSFPAIFPSLEVLDVSGCTSLAKLPPLRFMHSLRDLNLEHCKGLQALPALPDTLSYLSLSGCWNLEHVHRISDLEKVEVLDVSGCTSLAKLPSLGSMHFLRDLNLEDCEKLQALPALPDTLSSLSLKHCKELQELPALPDTLRYLSLSGCRKLQEVYSISHLKKLKVLDVSECTSLTELPSFASMYSLSDLTLDFCDNLEKLPALPESLVKVSWKESIKQHKMSSMFTMHPLRELKLENCYKLKELRFLPQNFIRVKVSDCYNLQDLSSISHMLNLETLELSLCTGIIQLPELNCMRSLRELTLDSCDKLEELPCLPEGLIHLKVRACYKLQKISHMSHMRNLKTFDLSLCISVITLPELASTHSLRELKVKHCESLEELPSLPEGLINLSIVHCHRLQKIPNMSHIRNLKALDLSWCMSVIKLPELDALHSLGDLTLEHCEELEELPSLPKDLRRLNLHSCYKLRKIMIMSEMRYLKTLQLPYCTNLTEISLLGLLKNLNELTLEYCEKLQELPCLPEGLMNLSLVGCNKLQNILSISCMSLLETLNISSCISLTKLPKLDDMCSLRGFKVEHCENLEDLPSLPVNLNNLSLVHCYKLQNISSMCHTRNLETVDLSWCINLRKLPELNAVLSLRELKIEHCVILEEFPSLPESVTDISVSRCYKLHKIDMSNMRELKNLHLPYCRGLTKVSQLDSLECLRKLTLEFCEELNELPALPGSLTHLNVRHCYKLKIKNSMSHLRNLESLDLSSCISLTELPEVDAMYSLRELKIEHWENLEKLPSLPKGLINLSLVHCYKLQDIASVSYVSKLETLDLSWCTSLAKLPNFDCRHSLRELMLEHCEKLEELPSLPEGLINLNLVHCYKLQNISSVSYVRNLENLDLSWCTSLTNLPSFDHMHSLRELVLEHREKLEDLPSLAKGS